MDTEPAERLASSDELKVEARLAGLLGRPSNELIDTTRMVRNVDDAQLVKAVSLSKQKTGFRTSSAIAKYERRCIANP